MESKPITKEGYTVELQVNGKKIGLKPFVQDVFYNVITGIVSTLKKVQNPEEIVLKIKK